MIDDGRKFWRNLSIRYKAPALCGILLFPLLLLMTFMTIEFHTYRVQTDTILLGYAQCIDFARDFKVESALLSEFVYPIPSQKAFDSFSEAHTQTIRSWGKLEKTAAYDSKLIAVQRQAISQAISHYHNCADMFLLRLQEGTFDEHDFAALEAQANYISVYINELIELLLLQGQEAYQNVIHHAATYNNVLFTSVFISALVLAAGMMLMLDDISKPIRRLSDSVRDIENQGYHVLVADTDRGDELGLLARAIAAMQARIGETIHALEAEAQLEKELRIHQEAEARLQQEAEKSRFAQLQSQINPHFLFNTLQSIATMAEFEQAAVAGDMTVRLANFFRYTLETDDAVVPLSRELDLLRDYVSLQEMRFAERFEVEMDCDPACASIPVPKFLLQPLVENAIVHGMRQRTTGGRIRVAVRRKGDCAAVIISDNGCGFRRSKPVRSEQYHIGIANIAQRVSMFGGSFYLFSLPGLGTAAHICIPFRTEDSSCLKF